MSQPYLKRSQKLNAKVAKSNFHKGLWEFTKFYKNDNCPNLDKSVAHKLKNNTSQSQLEQIVNDQTLQDTLNQVIEHDVSHMQQTIQTVSAFLESQNLILPYQ